VLGTLPGEESLRRGEYYAHPRNLFWPIIFALFGETPPPAYSDRVRSSADTTIAAEAPTAIDALLDTHPGIRAVAFNGSAAQRLYDQHFARRPALHYFALPSTSPAHARLGFQEKLARWTVLREVLDD
jgi:TDG/mug DNA glycosylase family protein